MKIAWFVLFCINSHTLYSALKNDNRMRAAGVSYTLFEWAKS